MLLGTVPGVKGVKTGWTQEAQGVLITLTERNGHEIITVVMDSPTREEDNKTLIDWTFAHYEW
jgi:D-alanyl-D-alanine carboxypeptidase (penicillin-binding protein 5/6)